LPFIYAPHERGQHLCHRVLSVACSGFLTVADIECPLRRIDATRLCAELLNALFNLGCHAEDYPVS